MASTIKTRWALRGTQVRDNGGRGQHVATYMRSAEDGKLLAAAPELLDMLQRACNWLDRSDTARHGTKNPLAMAFRLRLRELGLTPPPPECACRCYFERTGEHADGCSLAESTDEEKKES